MKIYSKSLQSKIVSLFLLLEIITIFSGSAKLLAQTNFKKQTSKQTSQKTISFVPPGNLKPKTSTGGASRNSTCNTVTQTTPCLTPLIPNSQQGLTLESHPSFLLYVPKNIASEIVFLSIKDENNNDFYQTKITFEKKTGIVKIKLPSDAPGLEIGKDYQWSVALMSGGTLKPDTPFVQGYVRRINAELAFKEQLERATALERASAYGKAGLWYETVATLADLKQSNHNDANITSQWQQLLTSVGLEKIVTQPFAE